MICPTCGTHIPDSSLRCPACHSSVSVTIAMPMLQGRWCPNCGVAVGWQDEVCPACGLPLENEWGVAAPRPEASQSIEEGVLVPQQTEDSDESEDTRILPRIESAIPPEDDPESKVSVQENMPHVGRLVVAGLFAVALVGGFAYAIKDLAMQDSNNIKATEEADLSMVGFPGTVEELSGQDNGGAVIQVLSGDDATYALLEEAYEKLGSYSARAEENEALFVQVAYGDDIDARSQGKRDIEALAIDLSNLIEEISQTDVSSGLYYDDQQHLITLASWLRNWVDTLRAAWAADVKSADPAAEREQIEALFATDRVEDGRNTYQVLFADNYAGWSPQKKEAS